jgi:Mg2+/Co2+ transporter CorC
MDESSSGGKMSRKVMLEELSKIEASDLMIPRSDVAVININSSFIEVIDKVISDGHSRFPVFSEKIDNIVGILYVKDLLPFLKTVEMVFDITHILRKPSFVSENKKASELLSEFREERVHLAIVVDEYGTMLGIVTLEDILEEIVGDISDEYDEEEELKNYTQLKKNEYIILPKMPIDEFNTLFKTRITSEDYETIGGFLLEKFGYVPKEGESIEYGYYKMTIKEVHGSKIKQILLKKE